MSDEKNAGRASEVSDQMGRMSKELARAGELQSELCERLQSVLRDETSPPDGKNEGQQPEESLTTLASDIRVGVRQLQRMTGGYESMVERLAL